MATDEEKKVASPTEEIETEDIFDKIVEDQSKFKTEEEKAADVIEAAKKTKEKTAKEKADEIFNDKDDPGKNKDKEKGKGKEKDTKDKGEKSDEKKPEDEEDDDPFKLDEELDPKDEIKKTSYKPILKKLNLDLEEGEDDNEDVFVSKINQQIEEAKTKTVLDLSKYNDEQKALIELLEVTGTQSSFFDPLGPLNDFMALSDAEKLSAYLKTEKGVAEKDIQDEIDKLTENGEFDKTLKKINDAINAEKKEVVSNVINKAKERANLLKAKEKQEKKLLADLVTKTSEFMGEKLPQHIKDYLLKSIDSGQFMKQNNTAEAQLNARLFNLFGSKILKSIEKRISEGKRSGYQEGRSKEFDKLHDTEKKNESKSITEKSKQASVSGDDPLKVFLDVLQEET